MLQYRIMSCVDLNQVQIITVARNSGFQFTIFMINVNLLSDIESCMAFLCGE